MTDEAHWAAVDRYLTDQLVPSDAALDAALASSAAAGLPAINVAPNQGKLLQLLARALPPGGKLITLEYEPKHADVARANIERAGLSHVVDIRLGKAIDSLPRIAAEGGGPFDFVFIDADKPGNADYFAWALKLSHVGTMIVVDNVVRKGGVTDASGDANVQGARRVLEAMSMERRVSATAVQTVGSKGHDG